MQDNRNFRNRTLFWGDNIDFMRAMNSDTVDLIATDPPFNKGRDFHATPDSLAAGASFQDRWKWDEESHPQFTDALRDDPKNANIWTVIESARASWGDDMGAFLCFMGVRLMEMHRLLKPTGRVVPQFEILDFRYGPRGPGTGSLASICPTIQRALYGYSAKPAAIAGVAPPSDLWGRQKL